MEIICRRRDSCSFRVHDQYFKEKTRFTPTCCPRCNGPLMVVEAGTDTIVSGAHVQSSEYEPNYRGVVVA